MRFKSGDPLIDLLQCMRQGKKLPTPLWRKFQGRYAKDAEPGVPDPRFFEDKFRYGFCTSIYWSSLARVLSHRAVLDAKELQVPLVMLQAADECCDLKQDAAFRFLNMTNPNKTGHMHGVFPCHILKPHTICRQSRQNLSHKGSSHVFSLGLFLCRLRVILLALRGTNPTE